MTGKLVKPIQTNEFCVTSSRKGLRDSGLDLNQTVMVVGHRVFPEKRSDPYLQRIYVMVVVYEDGEIKLPNNEVGDKDNGYRVYLVDPRCLTRLSEEEQLIINNTIKQKMGKLH